MASRHSQVAQWQNDLIPHIVDRLARETPAAEYALYPKSAQSYDQGFLVVTYKDFSNIVNGLAWWLEENLGRAQNLEVLGYIGPNDVRYTALVLAAVKAGYVLFLTSPRNSAAAQASLFGKLQCRTLLTSHPKPPAADPVIAAVQDLRHLEIPSVSDLLNTSHAHYELRKTYESSSEEPLWIIHTSGSTGIPKPLSWSHGAVMRCLNQQAADPPPGYESVERKCQGKRFIITLPPFHGAGLTAHLFNSVCFGTVMISPVAAGLATAESIVDARRHTHADFALLVPSIVAELSQEPALLDYCAKNLDMIFYIGGDLPQHIGDTVAARMPLQCQFGASEMGITPQIISPELKHSDWRYVIFHPCLGLSFEEISGGSSELLVKRNSTLDSTMATFHIRPLDELKEEYRSRDLFERHPLIHDAWCWRARADDIIVFLNGEKTNPVSMEQHVAASNKSVMAALVIGTKRFQAALLIEPTPGSEKLSTSEEAAFIEDIWPSVHEANLVAPAHARIEKSLILLTKPDRPFVRAGKGTIQRGATLMQYTDEIETLYKNAEVVFDGIEEGSENFQNLRDINAVSSFVGETIRFIAGWSTLDEDANIFDLGMDSLQALRVMRRLRGVLCQPDIALSTIYANPTISRLSRAILNLQDNGQLAESNGNDLDESLLKTYRDLIHQMSAASPPRKFEVLLTGSTGTLGSYLLHSLLKSPKVSHVHCLNRKDDSQSIQQRRNKQTDLPDLDFSRLSFIRSDLAQPDLGLSNDVYDSLRTHVDLIIHNAWPVNFNLSLSSFRPHLAGLVNLFSFAASAPHPPQLLFISSISAVGEMLSTGMAAPETVVQSLDAPFNNGYARSKFLSEQLCKEAAEQLHIPISIARVGQIAGPVHSSGVWNPAEWIPSLVISSLYLGCIPDSLGSDFSQVDWMPVDILADSLCEIAARRDLSNSIEVFNFRNPRVTQWSSLLPSITAAMQHLTGRTVEVVSPNTWLEKLQNSLQETLAKDSAATNGSPEEYAAVLRENPAIKLFDFYQKVLRTSSKAQSQGMIIDQAATQSESLKSMPVVGEDWVFKWVSEWMAAHKHSPVEVS